MAGNQPPLKKSKLEVLNEITMDVFPAELVGKILSLIVRARDIAVASATCRKWREAARNYTEKLCFDDSDWPNVMKTWSNMGETLWSVRELIIVEAVMRTTCLKELSICCKHAAADGSSKMHAGNVMACLLHVKRMLKSFTLTSSLMPNVNILDRLASRASVLEHLEWHHAHIPTLSTCVNGFPSLVSLALDEVVDGLSAQNFMLILSVFPNLEHLSVKNVCITKASPTMELDICTLKTLKMESISSEGPQVMFVLCDDKLGRLCLKELPSGCLHWERREGSESMQYLRLRGLYVTFFDIGECLGHLELKDVDIPILAIKGNLQHLIIKDSRVRQLKLESLDALVELKLQNYESFEKAWRHIFSRILAKVGLRLRKLTARGGSPEKRLINVDAIAWAFPSLQTLSLDYQTCYYDESAVEPPLFEEITYLDVHTVMLPEDCIPFTQWISGLLLRCPNLQSLVIVPDMALTTEPFEHYDFLGDLSSLLIPIMRPRPHINVSFKFSK